MLPSSAAAGRTGTRYIGVSTKMYLGYQASLRWLQEIRSIVQARPALVAGGPVRVFVIPSFPVLESAHRILDGVPVLLGAQNCGWSAGPFTGETSASMLAEMGVQLVEIGHAERRELFGEDDAVIARKTTAALDSGITPLLCIGEPERMTPPDAARYCTAQVLSALEYQQPAEPQPPKPQSPEPQPPEPQPTVPKPLSRTAQLGSMLLAYEPIWAIGATAPADPVYVNETVKALRALLQEQTGTDAVIIYGGSAGPGLLPQLGETDGLFLGRFAHDPANFAKVLDEALASH
ncbi:triosephosphate isomerase [Paenarthrobacter sp. Z7-10]|uniref:triose-phosphate isomerase family protein n=1 Tax=Paenarthrobacter sp. Z7-10 TaxID=2787635 RepID=UPI0022A93571|nr:triose-phosphate isomerase family protein [Paenarthrobacter sp. Z7-10]MCZ2403780.1 triosephosphate isomerase [Paenarthrobacter sp. Z7-10]